MRRLTDKEIQETELELLKQFALLCEKNGFRYSLGGGTLLGAIRHKGFIPWDDDVDVMMPRPDYDAFLRYCSNNHTPFKLFSHENEPDYINLFAKLSDPETILEDPEISFNVSDLGVHIDVFPVDGLGNTRISAMLHYSRSAFARELLNACSWRRYSASDTHGILFEPIRFVLFLLSRVISPVFLVERIESINKHRSFDTSGYAGCVSGSYRWKEILKTEAFQNYVDMHFENEEFKCIEQYDLYLKQHYGNYMELPPIDRQQTHHSFSAYRKDY